MGLTPQQRSNKLDRWKSPPSPAEEARLARARRMVTNAVKQHPPFAGLGLVVEPKGSWANNTNVSSDSDMDIKVEFTQRAFQGSTVGMSYWDLLLQNNSYNGPWTPEKFRSELGIALRRVSNSVDASNNVAFYVPSVPGSRPDTDAVPCFTYLHKPAFGPQTAARSCSPMTASTLSTGRSSNWTTAGRRTPGRAIATSSRSAL